MILPREKKRCTKCSKTKPLSDFYVSHQRKGRVYYMSACKACKLGKATSPLRAK